MTSDKKTVSLLADLFVKKGLRHIVISPGSRNAPIILAFANHPKINAISVVDERSAAFFALGMAQQTGKTVAIACTSGSAALNYAPAIAEAFYQKIPLLVLTADRPPELIDVGDGQTIRQDKVYANYIKKSYQLPLELDDEEAIDRVNRQMNEAIHLTLFPEKGPVHLNIPFDEPLYQTTSKGVESKLIQGQWEIQPDYKKLTKLFLADWQKNRHVMILVGQEEKDHALNDVLNRLSTQKNTVVLTETTSNVNHSSFIDCIDNVLATFDDEESKEFKPELLITLGNAVVSKKIKKFLRQYKPGAHWHLSESGEKRDTYFSLTQAPAVNPVVFLEKLISILPGKEASFSGRWLERKHRVELLRKEFLSTVVWSDLKVFEILLNKLPDNSNLHLGNSTPVRYSQLFGSLPQINYFSNRGVSGIDGQLSTAAGSAFVDSHLNILITGDLGFFYDSNALMNQNLKPNLKIIVMNNGGGGIFRFIPGPDSSNQLERFFEAKHTWKAEYLAKAFDIPYFSAGNEEELNTVLPLFFAEESRPALLEIFTPSEENAKILRGYFSFLKISSH